MMNLQIVDLTSPASGYEQILFVDIIIEALPNNLLSFIFSFFVFANMALVTFILVN